MRAHQRRRTLGYLMAAASVVCLFLAGALSGCTVSAADGSGATADATVETTSVDGTYTADGVTLTVPDGWTSVSSEDFQGVQSASGDGFVLVSEEDAAQMTMTGSVGSADDMAGFVSTMAEAEGADAADVAVSEHNGVWVAELPLTVTLDGTTYQGAQLLAGSGDEVAVVTALCSQDSYDAQWSTYQQVLDSATFDLSSAAA